MSGSTLAVYAALFSSAWLATLVADNVHGVRRAAGAAVFTILLLFTALRGYSIDYAGYLVLYEIMASIDAGYPERLLFAKDALWGVLIDVILYFGAGPQWMFLFAAVVSVGLKHRVYREVFNGHTAPAWAVTLCMYFFLHDFVQSRVAVAISICFVALLAVLNGRWRSWLLLTAVATGFHLSAAIFLPVSAVLLLPERRRPWAMALVVAGICIVGLTAFELIGSIDLRIQEHALDTGANLLPLVINSAKLLVLLVMASVLHCAPVNAASQRLVWPCVMFAAVGLVLLLAFRGTSSALAFRLYEFFDAFSVFVIAAALMQRRPVPVLLALGCCALGIAQQAAPGLLTPYELAPWSRWLG